MSISPPKPSVKLYSPMKSPIRAESPTTVRPLEMDDDEIPEPSSPGPEAIPSRVDAQHIPKDTTTEDEPPAKPPRPLNPQQQAENTLMEAFPTIDVAVVKAVLRASSGCIEPAFNALLGMSDPDAAREPSPPPQSTQPTMPTSGSTPLSQLEADEQYARQLAEHYRDSGGPGWTRETQANNETAQSRGPTSTSNRAQGVHEERSFIDDDLPIIRDNLKKGFLETQNKVNSWITILKKKIEGEDEDDNMPYGYGSTSRPRRSNEDARSGDYNRYDADPQVFGDDLESFHINSDGTPARYPIRQPPPQKLSKPLPAEPKSSVSSNISLQGDFSEENDIYRASPKSNTKNPPKLSKWQPLSTVEPSPVGETEHDPFSLGDSEDEKDVKDRLCAKPKSSEDSDMKVMNSAETMASNITVPTKNMDLTDEAHGSDNKNRS